MYFLFTQLMKSNNKLITNDNIKPCTIIQANSKEEATNVFHGLLLDEQQKSIKYVDSHDYNYIFGVQETIYCDCIAHQALGCAIKASKHYWDSMKQRYSLVYWHRLSTKQPKHLMSVVHGTTGKIYLCLDGAVMVFNEKKVIYE